MAALGAQEVYLKFLPFLLVLSLPACTGIVDKSDMPIAKNIVGSYYLTAKDGYLYEARCADIDATIQSTEWCIGIQAFDSGNEYFKTPQDYDTYLSNKLWWDEKLFEKLAFERQRSIVSPLPKGTTIRITKLVQFPWGSNGYYWAIRAVLIETDNEIELPTNTVLAFPTWLIGYGVQHEPQFDPEYLTRCSSVECT